MRPAMAWARSSSVCNASVGRCLAMVSSCSVSHAVLRRAISSVRGLGHVGSQRGRGGLDAVFGQAFVVPGEQVDRVDAGLGGTVELAGEQSCGRFFGDADTEFFSECGGGEGANSLCFEECGGVAVAADDLADAGVCGRGAVGGLGVAAGTFDREVVHFRVGVERIADR